MKKPSNSPLKSTWRLQPKKLETVWDIIGKKRDFDWDIGNIDKIKHILDEKKLNELVKISDSSKKNRYLREIISPLFLNLDMDIKRQLVRWIVFDWGRIIRGIDDAVDWVDEIRTFNEDNIKQYIINNKTRRISSWSKVLAFYNPNKHAIYDSRVAIALNVALLQIKSPTLFYMPQSRSKETNNLASHIKKQKILKRTGTTWDYFEYIEFLNVSVEHKIIKDLLDGEMRIFANSKKMMINYNIENNLGLNITDN